MLERRGVLHADRRREAQRGGNHRDKLAESLKPAQQPGVRANHQHHRSSALLQIQCVSLGRLAWRGGGSIEVHGQPAEPATVVVVCVAGESPQY